MKKLFSILLVAMLIVTSLATVAFAAESATVSASSVTAKAGDEVTISFTLSGGQFAGYGMKITADPTLTLTGVQEGAASDNGNFIPNLAPEKLFVVFGSAYPRSGGVIFTATFKVAADAQPGKYPVSVIVDNVYDENANRLNVSVAAGYVTVACDHSWGAWRTVETPTCTKAGKAERTCSVGGEKETKTLPALSHEAATDWSYDETNHWHVCNNGCDKIYDLGEHELEWVITKNPTNSTTGLKHQECEICGYKLSDVEIPVDPDLDDVPGTGDITPMVHAAVLVILGVVFAIAFLVKRMFTRHQF